MRQCPTYTVKAAVLAAKENTTLPVFVTMTFDETAGHLGCDVRAMACTLEGLGADAIVSTVRLGQKYIQLRLSFPRTSLPIIIKPNAGLPDQ